MPVYSCEHCHFTTPLKGNYTTHVASQKHIRAIELVNALRAQEQPVVNPVTTQVAEIAPEFTCKHCDQKFSFRQSMNRHIKHYCKNKDKDQDLNEMIRLMKVEMEQQKNDLSRLQKQSEELDPRINQIEKMLWKIEIKEEIKEEIKTFMIGMKR